MAVRGVTDAFDPNAPPMYGLMQCTLPASMPNCSATPFLSAYTNWLGSRMVSSSSCHVQVVQKSSIGLWCCVGVAYSASTFTGATANAASASPTFGSLYVGEISAAACVVVPAESKLALGLSAA